MLHATDCEMIRVRNTEDVSQHETKVTEDLQQI